MHKGLRLVGEFVGHFSPFEWPYHTYHISSQTEKKYAKLASGFLEGVIMSIFESSVDMNIFLLTKTCNISIHANILQVITGSFIFKRIILRFVIHGKYVFLPELCIVIKVYLGIKAHDYMRKR